MIIFPPLPYYDIIWGGFCKGVRQKLLTRAIQILYNSYVNQMIACVVTRTRKVRAPHGRVQANGLLGRPKGKCNRKLPPTEEATPPGKVEKAG